MANQSWPSGLPDKPLSEGYQEKTQNNILRTEMDQGPDKVRRITTANTKEYQMTFRMDESQVATFEDFFNNTIAHGSLKFDFDDPRTGTTREWRVVVPPEPTITNLGGNVWNVRMTWEKLPN